MVAGPNYVQLIGPFWEWVKKDVGLWARTVGSLRNVLADYNDAGDEALIDSLRLSAFSTLISVIMDISAETIYTKHSFSVPYGISTVVLYYMLFFGYGISLKLASLIVVSVQPMRKCVVMALFSAVYQPIINVIEFIAYDDPKLISMQPLTAKDFSDLHTIIDALTALIVWLVISTFVLAKTVSAVKYVFCVGLARALIAVMSSVAITTAFLLLLRPLWLALFKQVFSS